MSSQEVEPEKPADAHVQVCTDTHLLGGATQVITQYSYSGLTLGRLADNLGTSRMTLHRRGVTLAGVVAGLSAQAASELRDALFPILTGTQPANDRLRAALEAMCDVADQHLPFLAGLFSDDAGVFHESADQSGALPTDEAFVAPFVKLLADGEVDGTLTALQDKVEMATILFNTAGWGYIQLRHTQRWPHLRARDGVIQLVLDGLVKPT